MRTDGAATRAPALFLLLGCASAAAAPRSLTLAEALQLARRGNLELRQSALAVDRARIAARGALGALGPRLRLDANVTEWNDRFVLDIGSVPFLVREAFTSTVTLSGTQPLSGLFPRVERYRASADERGAAEQDHAAARADLALHATLAYLRLLEAIDVQRVAAQAVADATEQSERTRALVADGRLIDADLLRAQVALARARQEQLAADEQAAIARATLAAVIGLPVDSDLSPAPVDLEHLPPLPERIAPDLDGARSRPEVRAAQARARAAQAAQRAAIGDMLPSVDVAGGYQNTAGQSFFPTNAGYVSGLIGWDFWEWGTRYAMVGVERTRTEEAALEVQRRQRDVALEVTTRFVEARSARAALDVARAAVAQAEEAYRVMGALRDNGRATTTDLLDAQLAKVRARVDVTRAAYRYLVAHAAFERAVGVEPGPR